MKNKTIFSVATMLAIGVAGAAHSQFDGPYDPVNWTFNANGGDGSFTNDGFTLSLTGNNDSFAPADTNTDYTIFTVASGAWSFNWNYSTTDTGTWDDGGYLLNGAYTALAFNNTQGSGSESIAVSAGDVIGFRVHSQDGFSGPGILTISNFSAPIPGPAAAALLGVAGVLGRRSRRRRT